MVYWKVYLQVPTNTMLQQWKYFLLYGDSIHGEFWQALLLLYLLLSSSSQCIICHLGAIFHFWEAAIFTIKLLNCSWISKFLHLKGNQLYILEMSIRYSNISVAEVYRLIHTVIVQQYFNQHRAIESWTLSPLEISEFLNGH